MRFLIIANLLITAVGSFSTHSSRIAPSDNVVASGRIQQNRQPPFDPILHKQNQRRKTSFLSSNARDEEIAKLEAQLRQLRESENSDSSEDDPTSAATTSLDPEDERTLKAFAEARRRLEKVKGKDMLLTEQELIKGGLMDGSSNSNFGGAIPAVAVVIAAFVGLIVFAQIPIGQEDLARYSVTGSSTLKSIDLGDLNPDVANKL